MPSAQPVVAEAAEVQLSFVEAQVVLEVDLGSDSQFLRVHPQVGVEKGDESSQTDEQSGVQHRGLCRGLGSRLLLSQGGPRETEDERRQDGQGKPGRQSEPQVITEECRMCVCLAHRSQEQICWGSINGSKKYRQRALSDRHRGTLAGAYGASPHPATNISAASLWASPTLS